MGHSVSSEHATTMVGLIDAIPDAACLKAGDGTYLYCNPAYARLVHAADHASLPGRRDHDFFGDEIGEVWREAEQQAIETGFPVMLEQPCTLQGNWQERLLQRTSSAVHDQTGALTGILVVIHDITRQRDSERAMMDRLVLRDKLEMIASVAPGIVFSMQRTAKGSFRFPFAGRRVEDILGLYAEDLAHDAGEFFPRIPSEELKQIRVSLDISADQLSPWFERFRFHHPQRGNIWLEAQCIPVYEVDGGIIWHGYMHDISWRVQNEERLQMLSLATEQSPNAIVIADTERRIEYINPAYTAMTGYAFDEAVGKPAGFLISEHTSPDIFENLKATLKLGRSWTGQLNHLRKDGGRAVAYAHITPIRQANGDFAHYLAILEDLTEHKRMGEALDQHRHRLADLVAERGQHQEEHKLPPTIEPSQPLAQPPHPVAAAPVQNMFLPNAATPASSPAATVRPSNTLAWMVRIGEAAENLQSLIQLSLDVSRIQTGQFTLARTRFYLDDVVQQVQQQLVARIEAKHLSLELDVETIPDVLLGDPTRVAQILTHYLDNAAQFTEHGSITLRTRLVNKTENRLLLRIEVSDTGPGIAQERHADLFSALDGNAPQQIAPGLGLALVKQLAQCMSGTVGLESRVGSGSTFWAEISLERAILPTKEIDT